MEKLSLDGLLQSIEKDSSVRSLIQFSPVCHKIFDPDFKLRFMSHSGVVALQIENIEDFYGHTFPTDSAPKITRDIFNEHIRLAAKGETNTIEYSFEVDGNVIWYRTTLSPFFDTDGNLIYITADSMDITEGKKGEMLLREAYDRLEARVKERTKELNETNRNLNAEVHERKQSEISLIKSQALFQTLAKASPVGIFKTDADGLCTYVNARWCEITGLQPEEAKGSGWGKSLHPDDREMVFSEWEQAAKEDQNFKMEYRFQSPNGKISWVLGQAEVEKDGKGNVTGHVGTITNITERKRSEESLKFNEEKLKKYANELERSNNLLKNKEGELLVSKKIWDILQDANSLTLSNNSSKIIFENFLDDLLIFTKGQYGFIGEVLYQKDEIPYLRQKAVTNIAWNDESRKMYSKQFELGMEWHALDTLFGSVLTSGESVIANDPTNDPRSGGLPSGHPPLNAFLGIPIKFGGQLVGMVGLANKEGGYDKSDEIKIKPYLDSCATIIHAYKEHEQRALVEQKLKFSNDALELTNKELDASLR